LYCPYLFKSFCRKYGGFRKFHPQPSIFGELLTIEYIVLYMRILILIHVYVSKWTPQVESQIFQSLNNRDLKTCRLVCKQWNSTIETGTGLSVILDDRVTGNLNFINRVVYRDLIIEHLRTNSVLSPSNNRSKDENVNSLKTFGRLYPKTFLVNKNKWERT